MISLFSNRKQAASPEPVTIGPYGGFISEAFLKWRWPLMVGFTLFCFAYGFIFAITAPHWIVPLATPLAVMGLMAVWALPDLKTAPTSSMAGFMLAFLICLFAWPNYLAIALPGLPWVTLLRLTGIPMALLLLTCASVSKDFRTQLMETANAIPLIWRFLVVFVIIQFVTIAFSKNIPFSIQKFIVFQTNWTAIFVVSCYAFLKRGRIEFYVLTIVLLAAFVSGIGLWELHLRRLPWLGHIPSFLKIDDAESLLASSIRRATGMYRVKSTSTTPLGLAEFLALAAPFALHLMVGRYNLFIRAIGAASVLLFTYVIKLTDARLGMAGLFVGGLTYLLGWSVARWLKEKGSLIKAAIVFAYPAFFCMAVAATFFVGKLRKSIWGTGATKASNNARQAQIDRGIPIVLEQPWGHGPGQGGRALGYYSFSFLTIDNYYLAIALEYGIIGFILYYGMILLAIWNGGKYYALHSDLRDREQALLLPITASLCTFFVIKAVFSNQDNHPLMFMMMGMVVALVYRIKAAQPSEPAKIKGRKPQRRLGNAGFV